MRSRPISHLARLIIVFLISCSLVLTVACSGCEVQRRKSDGELGLNPQQASGRHIYDQYCDRCHEPYSSSKRKGPSLQGVFRKEYFSVSGMPANNQRGRDLILYGRDKMPSYQQELTQQQIDD